MAFFAVLFFEIEVVLDELLGPGHPYTMAGLRGGGTTYFYLRDKNIPDLLRKGRWSSPKTLEHYVQLQSAYLTRREWSDDIQSRLLRLASPWMPLLAD